MSIAWLNGLKIKNCVLSRLFHMRHYSTIQIFNPFMSHLSKVQDWRFRDFCPPLILRLPPPSHHNHTCRTSTCTTTIPCRENQSDNQHLMSTSHHHTKWERPRIPIHVHKTYHPPTPTFILVSNHCHMTI